MPICNVLFLQAWGVFLSSTHVKKPLGILAHTCSQNGGVEERKADPVTLLARQSSQAAGSIFSERP